LSATNRIIILGAGFAGLTLATELDNLAAEGKAEVTLVDRSPNFSVGFSMQWSMIGRRKPEDGQRPYTSLRAKNVRFLQDDITDIDPESRTVTTSTSKLEYDHLIIALGAAMAPERIPGLIEASYDLHDTAQVMELKGAIEQMKVGNLLIMVTAQPFKCPPGPYEYAMLIAQMLKERGVRDNINITLTTPEPQPMPVAGKIVGDTMKSLISERGIEYHPQQRPVTVDPAAKVVTYEDGTTRSFDVLAAVYPHTAPQVVKDAGLTDDMGFVPAKLGTFETKGSDVYAVGDIAGLRLPDERPHPKNGAFAEEQAKTVAMNLIAKITVGGPAEYSGLGVCFVDAGDELAAALDANLFGENGPQFNMNAPSREGLQRKVGFEQERLLRWFGG